MIALVTSDRKFKASRGLEMKDLRDLNDLIIHDVKPLRVESFRSRIEGTSGFRRSAAP